MSLRESLTDVLIVGAGPAGLALAIELGLRAVRCIVVEQHDRVGYNPRAKLTNVRSREILLDTYKLERRPVHRRVMDEALENYALVGEELARGYRAVRALGRPSAQSGGPAHPRGQAAGVQEPRGRISMWPGAATDCLCIPMI